MLSIRTIDKAVQARDHERLLRDLAQNGMVMPLPLRVQLAESSAGARGLALRRLVELTFGPTQLMHELIRGLLRSQTPSGAVADAAGRPSCLLTAAFAAGLGRAIRDHGSRLGELKDRIDAAYRAALTALAAMQGHDALFVAAGDRDPQDKLRTSAFIAYLLIDAPDFAQTCRGHELLSALEDRLEHAAPDSEQLISMARLSRLAASPAQPPASEVSSPAPHHQQPLRPRARNKSEPVDVQHASQQYAAHGRSHATPQRVVSAK